MFYLKGFLLGVSEFKLDKQIDKCFFLLQSRYKLPAGNKMTPKLFNIYLLEESKTFCFLSTYMLGGIVWQAWKSIWHSEDIVLYSRR